MTKGDNKNRKAKFWFSFSVALLVFFIGLLMQFKSSAVNLTYGELIKLIDGGEVSGIEASIGSNYVDVLFKDSEEIKIAVIPSLEEFSSLVSEKIENGQKIEFKVNEYRNEIYDVLLKFIPYCFWGYVVYMAYKMSKPNISVPQKETITNNSDISKIKFSDVAGIEEEKEQLVEIVDFLKHPKKYIEIGAKIPKGVLLYGGPGTGKTLLAKAIAGEAGVPFFQTNGSEFEEKFVGVGASRVRSLFAEAKKSAPSIIFIDEIDSVAMSRFADGHNYSGQTLNQILAEMDGFGSKDDVIVIAATNRIDVIDPAILRPGRFDRRIYVPNPDVAAREEILRVHAKGKRFSKEVSFVEVAKKTVGFSGADLENLLNEAAIYAIKNGKSDIDKEDIDEAIARVLIGLEKKNVKITSEDKKRSAIHEAGHAIVSAIVRPSVKNLGISIVPRGNAGGYNSFYEEERMYATKNELLNDMKVLYAGRIAEEVLLNDISTGASNDFERASKIAYMMVSKYAMDDKFMVRFGTNADKYDAKDTEIAEKICKKIYEEVKNIVISYKDVLLKLAELLGDKEYLSQEEVATFLLENLD